MPIQPLILSFRTQDQGGDFRNAPPMDEFYQNWNKHKLVLLIHGYNNPVPDARAAYEGFFSLQRQLAAYAPDGNFAPDRNFVEVFWKGDDWGILSPLYYMNAIPFALQTAEALADTLKTLAKQRAEGLELEVVAHSLGTRLTLELLRHIGMDRSITVTRIVFFAAATPTFMLEDPAEPHGLRQAYDSVLRYGIRSLHSGNDIVLSVAFPIGQTLASGHEGFSPTALGHERWESSGAPSTLEQDENRNANHWDYWGWKKDRPQCEKFANEQARDYLHFTGLGDRSLQAAATAERDTSEAPDTPERTIQARQTATRAV